MYNKDGPVRMVDRWILWCPMTDSLGAFRGFKSRPEADVYKVENGKDDHTVIRIRVAVKVQKLTDPRPSIY